MPKDQALTKGWFLLWGPRFLKKCMPEVKKIALSSMTFSHQMIQFFSEQPTGPTPF